MSLLCLRPSSLVSELCDFSERGAVALVKGEKCGNVYGGEAMFIRNIVLLIIN